MGNKAAVKPVKADDIQRVNMTLLAKELGLFDKAEAMTIPEFVGVYNQRFGEDDRANKRVVVKYSHVSNCLKNSVEFRSERNKTDNGRLSPSVLNLFRAIVGEVVRMRANPNAPPTEEFTDLVMYLDQEKDEELNA